MKTWNVQHPTTPCLGMIWFDLTVSNPPSDEPMSAEQYDAYAALVDDSKVFVTPSGPTYSIASDGASYSTSTATDQGDGTYTITGAVDQGDGTYTLSS